MKIGDKVKTTDGSYAQRLDSYDSSGDYIGTCGDDYEIIQFKNEDYIKSSGKPVHDVIIRNTVTERIYLHSKRFIRVVEPKIKEIRISDLESQYGCKVKIIK